MWMAALWRHPQFQACLENESVGGYVVQQQHFRSELMAYRAFIGKIRRGKESEYIDAHKAVWPELLAAMKKAGVQKEICFVRGNHIFVYVESFNIDDTMKALSMDSVNQRWDLYMEPLLEQPVEGCSDLFLEMIEVFRT
jgi:L-rhamnose mutarotase